MQTEALLNRLNSEKCPNSGHQLPQRAWEETQDPFSFPPRLSQRKRPNWLPIRNMYNFVFLPPPSLVLRNEQFWSIAQQNHLHIGSMEIFLLWLMFFQTFPLYNSLRMKIKRGGRGNRGVRGEGEKLIKQIINSFVYWIQWRLEAFLLKEPIGAEWEW